MSSSPPDMTSTAASISKLLPQPASWRLATRATNRKHASQTTSNSFHVKNDNRPRIFIKHLASEGL
jgi:hypothetical protein